ncbi:VanZ family protein [Ferriphaselus sp. R-1]|uniref:VanZ family protein n=1 Tax=Ferriphaselus sp. R-1 TaxID=1485544 RepID=UPI00069018B0|nr:VanZ family protein [Ferriphaselus sp. R-1]
MTRQPALPPRREPPAAPRIRLRFYLLATYVLFIVYVSLTPFSGWQDLGLSWQDVLTAPLLQTYTWFDALINVLAYLPFGLLLGLILRSHLGAGWSVVLAVTGGAMLSGGMELAQLYLPMRTGSNLDLLTNVGGTLGGALLAVSIAPRIWFAQHLFRLRRRLFGSGNDFGLTLVALWVFAQINPSLPMLGNVFISEVARKPFLPPPPDIFSWQESLAVTLNLLMLGSLLLMLLRERRHAVIGLVLLLCAVSLTKFIAAAALLKSWALFLWLNSEAMLGIAAGLSLLAAALLLSPRGVRSLAWLSCAAYLVLTHFVLDESAPSSALPLYQWRYLHLLNYNGLTQTVALVFPFLLLSYLWHRRDGRGIAV